MSETARAASYSTIEILEALPAAPWPTRTLGELAYVARACRLRIPDGQARPVEARSVGRVQHDIARVAALPLRAQRVREGGEREHRAHVGAEPSVARPPENASEAFLAEARIAQHTNRSRRAEHVDALHEDQIRGEHVRSRPSRATSGVDAQPTTTKRAPNAAAAQPLGGELAADRMVNDVGAVAARECLDLIAQARRALASEHDRVIGAVGPGDLELLRGAAGGDHPRTEELRQRHRGEPGQSRGAEHEHRLAVADARAVDSAWYAVSAPPRRHAPSSNEKPSGSGVTALAGATA